MTTDTIAALAIKQYSFHFQDSRLFFLAKSSFRRLFKKKRYFSLGRKGSLKPFKKKQIILLFSLDNDHEYLQGTAMLGVTEGLTHGNKQLLVLLLILSHSDQFLKNPPQ